jgi:hypothetical protein
MWLLHDAGLRKSPIARLFKRSPRSVKVSVMQVDCWALAGDRDALRVLIAARVMLREARAA